MRCVGTTSCWRKVKGGPGLGHAQVGKEIFQHEAKEVMHMMNSLQSSEMEPDDPQVRPSIGRQSGASESPNGPQWHWMG